MVQWKTLGFLACFMALPQFGFASEVSAEAKTSQTQDLSSKEPVPVYIAAMGAPAELRESLTAKNPSLSKEDLESLIAKAYMELGGVTAASVAKVTKALEATVFSETPVRYYEQLVFKNVFTGTAIFLRDQGSSSYVQMELEIFTEVGVTEEQARTKAEAVLEHMAGNFSDDQPMEELEASAESFPMRDHKLLRKTVVGFKFKKFDSAFETAEQIQRALSGLPGLSEFKNEMGSQAVSRPPETPENAGSPEMAQAPQASSQSSALVDFLKTSVYSKSPFRGNKNFEVYDNRSGENKEGTGVVISVTNSTLGDFVGLEVTSYTRPTASEAEAQKILNLTSKALRESAEAEGLSLSPQESPLEAKTSKASLRAKTNVLYINKVGLSEREMSELISRALKNLPGA